MRRIGQYGVVEKPLSEHPAPAFTHLPHELERGGKRLLSHAPVAMARGEGEDVLMVVALDFKTADSRWLAATQSCMPSRITFGTGDDTAGTRNAWAENR